MDKQGYVDLQVLANFNRVRSLTTDMNLIRDALKQSDVVELDSSANKVRRREGWETWILPASMQPRTEPLTSSSSSSAQQLPQIAVSASSNATNNRQANPHPNGKSESADDDGVFEFDDDWEGGAGSSQAKKYYLSEEEEDEEHEIDEDTIARIMIVTQRQQKRLQEQSDKQRINEDVSAMINEGLYHYETGLQRFGTESQEQMAGAQP